MNKILSIIFVFALAAVSCENDNYLKDGGVANEYEHINETMYEYLSSNRLFDTLVMAIDKAGLKDAINSAKTFYAPTNFAFTRYINDELTLRRTIDPEAVYTFDSIPTANLDSLRIYMFNTQYTRDDLGQNGTVDNSLLGMPFKLSSEPESLYSSDLTVKVNVMYFIKQRGTKFDEYDDYINNNVSSNELDTRIKVQTSNLRTKTGVIHVLHNTHTLFFHTAKL